MNEHYAQLEAMVKRRIEECERKGWSRNIGAGWVEADIEGVTPLQGEAFALTYSGHCQAFKLDNLNLRELDAVRDWLFKRIGGVS